MSFLTALFKYTRVITQVDNYVRLVGMTLLALVVGYWLGLSGRWLFFIVGLGMLIDLHDIASKFVAEDQIV